MRTRFSTRALAVALAAGAAGAAACGRTIDVRTSVSPDANLSGLRTFRVLRAPARRANAPALTASDPMLDNSITNNALRQDLEQAFEGRGYAVSTDSPDFAVAYYAGTKEKFDTTYWDPGAWSYGPWRYSYRGSRDRWAWPYYGWSGAAWAGPVAQLREYTQGTVIVDVVDPRSRELLWRGQGVAQVSDDPKAYTRQLRQAVEKVVAKFPHAATRVAQGS
jgi:hypothetical protein